MAAYIIVDVVEINDPQVYDEYRKLVPPTLEKYGGKFIVRGGKRETIEGTWDSARFVVIQFDNMEQAKAWHDSEEYRPALEMRLGVSKARMLLVEGI